MCLSNALSDSKTFVQNLGNNSISIINKPEITSEEVQKEFKTLLNQLITNFLGIKDCLSFGVYTSGGGGNMGTQAATWSAPFWVGIILAAIVGGSMWLLNFLAQRKPRYQKNTYQYNQNNNQQQNQMGSTMKVMNYFMIVMMVLASLGNNGLALYWVIGNLYSIGQNFINRYLNEKKYYRLKKEHSIDNLI